MNDILIAVVYIAVAALFIWGLREMSSPKTASRGLLWAGVGMVAAGLVTLLWPGLNNYVLIVLAVLIGGAVAWWSGFKVQMTDMPQMIALYNGMGGGAAATIAVLELMSPGAHNAVVLTLAILGSLIGGVSFSGSLIAFGKLQGLINKSLQFRGQHVFNLAILLAIVVMGYLLIVGEGDNMLLLAFIVTVLVLGILVTLPVGGADMPVVISLYNALTGLAVGFEGFVLNNMAMIVAGTVVGASGTLLTQLMAKSMNRSLVNVLFSGFGTSEDTATTDEDGEMKELTANDAASLMAYARNVIIVPGYGLAVAQAQHKLWEFVELIEDLGVEVKFAIHPVAGRMPGHMNVLLAEAGVPYDKIYDLDEINAEFEQADVALVIGANDVVNPEARTNKSSPIYGMPILNVDYAKNCIVVKRGRGTGFSGIQNRLFFAENTRLLFGDGAKVAGDLIQHVKALG